MGRCRKLSAVEADSAVAAGDSLALIRRYRLVWDYVVYTPGEIRVVAYDDDGRAARSRRCVQQTHLMRYLFLHRRPS